MPSVGSEYHSRVPRHQPPSASRVHLDGRVERAQHPQKLAHTVEDAERHTREDGVCLVETDVDLSPVNVKDPAHRRGLHAHDVHWFGLTHMHFMLEEGRRSSQPLAAACAAMRSQPRAGS